MTLTLTWHLGYIYSVVNQHRKRAVLPLCHRSVLLPSQTGATVLLRIESSQFRGTVLLIEREVWLLKGDWD